MVSSAHKAIACILLILATVAAARAQAAPEKNTASISGKVTSKGKGVPGILVVMLESGNFSSWSPNRPRATTDQTGNYRITNIPAGTYHVSLVTPALVVENDQANKAIVIADGETLEDMNFSLVRGGVITGKITDAEGRPLIEEHVTIESIDDQSGRTAFNVMQLVQDSSVSTDDRGVYRAFGLRAGKYKVSVGQGGVRLSGRSQHLYKQIFHPSVADPAKATLIEVTEGSETKDIDIVTGPAATTFKISGRIVDGETGKPLPNVRYGVAHIYENGSQSSTGGSGSNADGEFKLENILPGKYMIFIAPDENNELRPESVSFDVIDRDVTGLVIKAFKGASLSGVVVWENSDENPAIAKLSEMPIVATFRNAAPHYHHSPHGILRPDGSFKIAGMQSGVVHLSFASFNRVDSKSIEIVRIERNGVPQPNGINVKDGEQIMGIRLVAKYLSLSGSIRGQVKVENGELPPSAQMMVEVSLVDNTPVAFKTVYRSNQVAPVDARGRFIVNGLAAGTYDVKLMLFDLPIAINRDELSTQVVVTENSVSEVNLTLKLLKP
jgi:protocatechuate 3,4-dioxygenase beta subunit